MIYFIIFWLITWVISWGMHFAYWQRAYPTLAKENYKEDLLTAILFGMFPILNLTLVYFVLFVSTFGYQGFQWI